MRGNGSMLSKLSKHYLQLIEERGFEDTVPPVKFYYRGVRLSRHHRLMDFGNMRDGETITAVLRIEIIFEYQGNATKPYAVVFNDWANARLASFGNAFLEDYTRRTGDEAVASNFDFYLDGKKLWAFGDYIPPFPYMDNTVIVVKDHVSK